ncbi:oligopeptide transport system ATP-binding protein [Halanaerobium congolense]|jgi:oligopeptide/dipeptide ABC transporter ATP-binding protein|uniref:Oligopeptide transport system ATP-binding protein n=1 Tax=Halanaerobium congolense TaxID=54121 RepID=A0A1G8IAU9_9FIRM|nr:ABC transporter ATP-binding protein [Halanaerobium congolense]PUU91165.1 MAG: peptide/nickel transport system ATP-binding protein [Halanaerobium sp.]SDI16118.1 oligopeptide transport system ATP-binding protein [Halanaerobium congolense]SES73946.1 oligopeptide transport system ATP-binding protein [Halanaerobium congolense]
MKNKEVLLELRDLKTYFPVQKGVFKRTVAHVKAVDGVSINIYKGETLGLVGESGCGKTTLGKTILQLVKATAGEAIYNFDGEKKDLNKLSDKEMMKARKKLQIVFQDPHSSLNPAFTIFGSLQDPLKQFGVKSKAERKKIIGDLLEAVNLRREYMNRYPHEFSGGQRQRIGIARALSVEPELIVCDEAVSALDVSIQAQVLKLLQDLKEERNLTYLFITHDLSVVEYISDRIAVMYLGKIVELADSDDLYNNTLHPYTEALLSAIPVADLDHKSERIILEGNVPSPVDPPSGCPFHPRCPKKIAKCSKVIPELKKYEIDGREHYAACHLLD